VGHLSDSSAPAQVESLVLAAPATELNAELNPRWLCFPAGAYCGVDPVSFDEMLLVEAFARQGKPLGGQRGKIARDPLKFIRRERHGRGAQPSSPSPMRRWSRTRRRDLAAGGAEGVQRDGHAY
jgi:hypothetical protein